MPEMKTMFSFGYAEVGHHLLGLGEDRVVAAARAPADLLVGHEVLAGERDDLRVLRAERRRSRLGVVAVGLGRHRAISVEDPLGLVDDLGDAERLAADPVVADGVDEVARPDEQRAAGPG